MRHRNPATSLYPILFALMAALVPCIGQAGSDPVTSDPSNRDAAFPAALAEVAIDSHGSRLNGIVYLAQGAGPHPTVVLLHGFPGNEKNLDLAQAMRRAGFNVVFFHYRGSWGSEGDFSFGNSLQDVEAVLGWVRSEVAVNTHRFDPLRISIVGHSVGGFLALMTSANDASIRCTASIAGINLGPIGTIALSSPEAGVAVASSFAGGTGPLHGTSGVALRDELVTHRESFDLLSHVGSLAGHNLLLVGGGRDTAVPVERNHEPVVEALEAAKAVGLTTALLDADHAFSSRRIALARTVTDWLVHSCR